METSPCRHFEFIPGAYACSCAENGYFGDKFNINVLEIYADQDYNDLFPAGTPLNGLFTLSGGNTGHKPLQSSLPAGFGYVGSSLFLETQVKPQNVDLPYRFTVEITKSNGVKFVLQTGEVHF